MSKNNYAKCSECGAMFFSRYDISPFAQYVCDKVRGVPKHCHHQDDDGLDEETLKKMHLSVETASLENSTTLDNPSPLYLKRKIIFMGVSGREVSERRPGSVVDVAYSYQTIDGEMPISKETYFKIAFSNGVPHPKFYHTLALPCDGRPSDRALRNSQRLYSAVLDGRGVYSYFWAFEFPKGFINISPMTQDMCLDRYPFYRVRYYSDMWCQDFKNALNSKQFVDRCSTVYLDLLAPRNGSLTVVRSTYEYDFISGSIMPEQSFIVERVLDRQNAAYDRTSDSDDIKDYIKSIL